MILEPQHICHGGCPKHILKWNPDKALHYTEHLGHNTEGHNSFMKAIERKDVEAANNYLRAMIISAACTSGMGKFSPCVFYRKNQRVAAGARKAPWFDDECRRKRRDFLRSLRDGREDLQDTKKEYRKYTRRVARKFSKQQTAIFLDKLSKRDPAIYDMLKQRRTTCPSPVPTDAWNTYLLSHFNAKPPPKPPDALNRNSRHIDARASAVPLGRGRVSQGMSRTADAFDCPSLAVMTCLVSKFLGKMTASSSPGFEDFSAPFLKYAYPGDEKDKNVLVPYLANLFHVALSEKRISACWKKSQDLPPLQRRL